MAGEATLPDGAAVEAEAVVVGQGPRGRRVTLVAGGREETQTTPEWEERAGDRGEAMIEAGGKRREWSLPRGGRIPGD